MELMIVLALVGILATIAVPSFKSMIQNNRIQTQSNDVFTALNYARSEAVRRKVDLIVCSAKDDQSDCDAAESWANGWLIKRSDNNELLKVWPAMKNGMTVTDDAKTITFTSTGRSSGTLALTLTAPNCTGDQIRVISVNATGRTSVAKSSCP